MVGRSLAGAPPTTKKASALQSVRGAKMKKPGAAAPASAGSAAAAAAAANPFERRTHSRKFQVLGQRLKKTETNLGQSRARAVQSRRETLLPMLERMSKANAVSDRRIGEGDAGMSVEDKEFMRFQQEQMRKARRRNIFDLEDDDDQLTHFGAPLDAGGAMEQRPRLEDEGEDLDEDTVEANFGGFTRSEHRSMADVYSEMIAKSKQRRADEQREKAERAEKIAQLDEEFDSIRDLLDFRAERGRPADKDAEEDERGTDRFDRMVRSLALEGRAKATERLKTEDELAKEERERLDELERRRQRRMRGEESDEDAGATDDDSGDARASATAARAAVLAGGDDDDVHIAARRRGQKRGLVTGSDDEGASGDEQSSSEGSGSDDDEDGSESGDDDDDDDDESASGSDSDLTDATDSSDDALSASGDDDAGAGSEPDDSPPRKHGSAKPAPKAKASSEAGSSGMLADLPFVLDVPAKYSAFADLLSERTAVESAVIVDRIRASNHVSLAAENRSKLQRLFRFLLQHFVHAAGAVSPVPWHMLNVLVRPLFELAGQFPDYAATVAIEYIGGMRSSLLKKLSANESSLPSIRGLFFLRLLALLFPVTDLRHCVCTPALLLAGQFLVMSTVEQPRDALCGLFLCDVVHGYVRETKRFVPEVFVFLRNLLHRLADLPVDAATRSTAPAAAAAAAPAGGKSSKRNGADKVRAAAKAAAAPSADPWDGVDAAAAALLTWDSVRDLLAGAPASSAGARWTAEWGTAVLRRACDTAMRFGELYDASPSYPEAMQPLVEQLDALATRVAWVPEAVQRALGAVSARVRERSASVVRERAPLRLQTPQIVGIRMWNPQFEEFHASARRVADPDRERSDLQRLKKRHKRLKKQVTRELRRDAAFLSEVQRKERADADAAQRAVVRNAYQLLEEQAHDGNMLKKAKQKKNNVLAVLEDKLLSRRTPFFQIFYWGLVIGGAAFTYGASVHLLPNAYISSWHSLYFAIAIAVGLAQFFNLCYSDPGVVTASNVEHLQKQFPYDGIIFKPRICETCNIVKPARSKHCRICNQCVSRFDHHCPWFNTCIAHNNVRYFISFLLYHAFLCFYGAYIAFYALAGVVSSKQLLSATFQDAFGQTYQATSGIVLQYLMSLHLMVVVSVIYHIVVSVTLLLFGAFHVYLVANGTSTNETFKWDDVKAAYRGPQPLRNVYNRGILANFLEIIRPSVYPAAAAAAASAPASASASAPAASK